MSVGRLLPTQAYANLDNNAFLTLDLGKNIYPFGKEPKVDCILYLSCEELLQTADAYISIEMLLADSSVIPRPNPSEQLVLAFEYWDGKRWRHLGRSAPRGALPGAGDGARFPRRQEGALAVGHRQLPSPQGHGGARVNGITKRGSACASRRATSRAGQSTLENERWIYKDDRPLKPPALRSITFRYREDYRDIRHVLAFNDSSTRTSRGRAHRVHDLPAVQAKPERVAALFSATLEAAERSDRPVLPARRGAGPRPLPTEEARLPPPSSTSTRRCGGCRGRPGNA